MKINNFIKNLNWSINLKKYNNLEYDDYEYQYNIQKLYGYWLSNRLIIWVSCILDMMQVSFPYGILHQWSILCRGNSTVWYQYRIQSRFTKWYHFFVRQVIINIIYTSKLTYLYYKYPKKIMYYFKKISFLS